MKIEKLNLSHQNLLTERFETLKIGLSEYNFANAYLFRDIHHYEVVFDEQIFLKGMTRDGFSFLMPTCPLTSLPPHYLSSLLTKVNFLFPIPEKWHSSFDTSLFKLSFVEDDSDYLFTVSKLQNYPGRHLDGKRNFVKRFLSLYQSEKFPLTVDRSQDALIVLEEWQQEQEQNLQKTDYFACKEALQLLDKLNLSGHIVYIDRQPIAFTIGQLLTPITYVNHFIKAKKSFIGIYTYLYQLIAKSLDNNFQFINLEQDLGSSNLRKAKQSYHPDQMLHKLRVSLL
jgi:hypothetical protein